MFKLTRFIFKCIGFQRISYAGFQTLMLKYQVVNHTFQEYSNKEYVARNIIFVSFDYQNSWPFY